MKAWLKLLLTVVLCGAMGAIVYQVQHFCVNELLIQLHIKRHWHLSYLYDPWPLGAALGALTGLAIAAFGMQRPQAASRMLVGGGSVAAACFLDAVVLVCWWFNGKLHYGSFWSTTETIMGLLPMVAFGFLWAMLLLLCGGRFMMPERLETIRSSPSFSGA